MQHKTKMKMKEEEKVMSPTKLWDRLRFGHETDDSRGSEFFLLFVLLLLLTHTYALSLTHSFLPPEAHAIALHIYKRVCVVRSATHYIGIVSVMFQHSCE